MTSKFLLVLSLLASPLPAQVAPSDLAIDGPREGFVGEEIVLRVSGFPKLDLDRPLRESLAWTEHVQFISSAPDACTCEIVPELTFNLFTQDAILKLRVTADVAGTLVVVADWNEPPFGLAMHRMSIRTRAPPVDVSVAVTGLVNGSAKPDTQIKIGDQVVYEYRATASGGSLSDVTIVDTCGQPIVGPSGDANGNQLMDIGETWVYRSLTLAAAGEQRCTATVTAGYDGAVITGAATLNYVGVDQPGPDPKPGPPARRIAVIIYESEDVTPEIADALNEIRNANNNLPKPNQVVVIDKDSDASWLPSYMDVLRQNQIGLPAIVIVKREPNGDGVILHKGKLPANLTEYREIMKANGGFI